MKRSASKFAIMLTSLLLLSCLYCLTALAETAYVAHSANAYVKPDTASKSVRLSAGTKLEILAEKNGWAQVKLKGKTGYMLSADLAKVTYYSDKTVYVTETAAAYKGLSTSSKKIGTLAAGTAVKLQATAGDWAYVSLGGKKGYMKKAYLTSEAPAGTAEPIPTPTTEATPTPTPAASGKSVTAYAARDGVKVYKSWSTDSAVLTTLDANTAVTVTAVKSGWCRVEARGVTAYMLKSDLSDCQTCDPASTPVPETVTELKYGDKGEAVKALQRRLKELGYFSGEIGGNYLEQTQAAVRAFQSTAKLTADGVAGPATLKALASDSAPKAPAPTPATTSSSSGEEATGDSTVTPARGTAREMDWWDSGIQTIFARGTIAQVTDIDTGISWKVIRKGGTNHADVQPLTAADTAAMRRACGSWSWTRRAIWVTINGVNYAASMNCMPHGSGSITTNNFPGHHCIHFTNSRTHGTNRVCPLHQAAIKKAAAASR